MRYNGKYSLKGLLIEDPRKFGKTDEDELPQADSNPADALEKNDQKTADLISMIMTTSETRTDITGDNGEKLAEWLSTNLGDGTYINLNQAGGSQNFNFADVMLGNLEDVKTNPESVELYSVKSSNAKKPTAFGNSKIHLDKIQKLIEKAGPAHIGDELLEYFRKKQGQSPMYIDIKVGAIGVETLNSGEPDWLPTGVVLAKFGPTTVKVKYIKSRDIQYKKNPKSPFPLQVVGSANLTLDSFLKPKEESVRTNISSFTAAIDTFGEGKYLQWRFGKKDQQEYFTADDLERMAAVGKETVDYYEDNPELDDKTGMFISKLKQDYYLNVDDTYGSGDDLSPYQVQQLTTFEVSDEIQKAETTSQLSADQQKQVQDWRKVQAILQKFAAGAYTKEQLDKIMPILSLIHI